MRRLLLAALALAALPAFAQAPAPGDLVINELMYDPPAPQPNTNEWVEVLNVSGGPVDVGGLAVADDTGASDGVPAGTTLADGGYLVIVRNGTAFAEAYPGVAFVELAGFPTLNNTGDRLVITAGGTEIDVVPYRASWGGSDASLERIDPFGPSDAASNFGTSTAAYGGTPGAQNSIFDTDDDAPEVVVAEALDAQSVRVTFSEPVDQATAETPANYGIDGGIGTPLMADRQGDLTQVVLALAAPLQNGTTYTLTVQNVEDTRGNAIGTETATFLFAQGDAAESRDLVINEFLYDEPTSDNPGEFIELFNRSDKTFDLRDFTLNDAVGDDTPITEQAAFVQPGGYAVVVEDGELFAAIFPDVPFVEQDGWSALNNGGDAIVLKYQGARIDSLFYQPSWGGEDASLERKDPDGPSSVASNWATTTDVRGGTPGELNSQFAPDVAGPTLVEAFASPDGRRVVVTLSEPAQPASVTASAFSVTGATVEAVTYAPESTTVTIALTAPVAVGTATVTATGLTDLLGNTTDQTTTTFTYEGDDVPPTIVRATAQSARVVRVTYSEGITFGTGAAASRYSLSEIGTAESVQVVEFVDNPGSVDGVRVVDVTFPADLQERQLYTLTASEVSDLAGNVATLTARVFFGTADTPDAGDVVVNEIMFDPVNGSDGEYVELLNTTADGVFDLRQILLDDGDGDGDALSDEAAVLLPGERLAIIRDAEGFRATFPNAAFVEAGTVISLSNSGEAVVLRAAGTVLDSVFYDPDWHRVEVEDATGLSLERRDPAGPSNARSNWSTSLADLGGTPSAANTVTAGGAPVEREAGLTVAPSPFAPVLGEAAEITITLSSEASLVRARVYDGGGRPVRELEPGRLAGSTATLTWDGTGDDLRPVRAGIYVVLVEAVDAEGGTTEAVRGVVVVARPDGATN